MKPQDFADVHAFELARHEGRPAPRNPENFQTRYAQECDEARQAFDELVADREYVETDRIMYYRRIFQPVDLGKFVVGRARPHLFAQLSLEETYKSNTRSERVVYRSRNIEFFPDTAHTLPTKSNWSFLQPPGANHYALGSFIGGKVSLADTRHRAIPSSVAALKEFKDTLGHVMEAAGLEIPTAEQG